MRLPATEPDHFLALKLASRSPTACRLRRPSVRPFAHRHHSRPRRHPEPGISQRPYEQSCAQPDRRPAGPHPARTQFPDASKSAGIPAGKPAASRSRGRAGTGFQRRRRTHRQPPGSTGTKLHDRRGLLLHTDQRRAGHEGIAQRAEPHDAGGGCASFNAAAGLHAFLPARRFVTDERNALRQEGGWHHPCRRRRISGAQAAVRCEKRRRHESMPS